MTLRVKALIAATAIATLSATCAYAGGSSDQYGTWNDGSTTGSIGSVITNSQATLNTQWSNMSGSIDSIGGDAAIQGAAAGNLIDITTMNNTRVNNNQIVGSSAAIGSNIDMGVSNVWGSVGIQNQVMCNGASVSTDPTLASTKSYQECSASDPSSLINANVANVAGSLAIQGTSLGNSFEADSNAPNMPITSKQINNAINASTVNATASNIGGSIGLSSSAIGNTSQIIHYSTN